MTEIIEWLGAIWFVLFLVLLFKDMSGKSELREIKSELKRIAEVLEGMKNGSSFNDRSRRRMDRIRRLCPL